MSALISLRRKSRVILVTVDPTMLMAAMVMPDLRKIATTINTSMLTRVGVTFMNAKRSESVFSSCEDGRPSPSLTKDKTGNREATPTASLKPASKRQQTAPTLRDQEILNGSIMSDRL